MIIANEETDTKNRASNPVGAYLDAKQRGEEALQWNADFFAGEEHIDRLNKVADIVKSFFGRFPSYYTPRNNKGKPFESVKVADVGRFLSKKTKEDKSKYLYEPLLLLGNIDVKSKNGHLLIRVF
jgi:hypothetical protein